MATDVAVRWDQVAETEEALAAKLDVDGRAAGEDDDYTSFLEEVSDPLGLRSLGSELSGLRVNTSDIDPAREQFVASRFLALLHKETPIGKLHEGHEHLARRVESRQQQLNVLVQNNFHRFVGCKDTIDEIYGMLQQGGESLTDIQILEGTLKEVQRQARETFGRMITRQEEIDSIRSVLSILTRVKFRFIFQLPEVMEQDMLKKDYSKVVFQYKKVKVWLQDTNVTMFKQVLNQAEKTIQRLRMILFSTLENPLAKLELQEKMIRLLLSLGGGYEDPSQSVMSQPSSESLNSSINPLPVIVTSSVPSSTSGAASLWQSSAVKDPAWYCIAMRHKRICELLRDADNALGFSDANESRSLQSIRRLATIMQDLLPDFWKLTRSFFNLEYHKGLAFQERDQLESKLPQLESQFGVLMQEITDIYIKGISRHYFGKDYDSSDSSVHEKVATPRVTKLMKNTVARRRRNRPSITQYDGSPSLRDSGKEGRESSPKKQRKQNNLKSSSSGENKRSALKNDSSPRKKKLNVSFGEDELRSSHNDKSKSKERDAEKERPESNLSALVELDDLSDEEDVEKTVAEDREKVEAIVKCVKVLDANRIPYFYLDGVHKALDQIIVSFVTQTFNWALAELKMLHALENFEITDNVAMTTNLPTLFAQILRNSLSEFKGIIGEHDEVILKEVDAKFVECLHCLADNLHHLAFQDLDLTTLPESERIAYEAQLLVIMNNCRYSYRQLIPELIRQYCAQFQRGDPDRPHFMTSGFLKQLEEMLLSRYLKLKTLSINSVIQRGLLLSGFEWNRPTYFDGINDYVMEVLLKIVAVHEELCRLSSTRIRKILSTLVANVFEAYQHYLPMIDNISSMGKLQLTKELQFINDVMEQFVEEDGAAAVYQAIQVAYGLDKVLDPKTGEVSPQLLKTMQVGRERVAQDTLLLFECFILENVELPQGVENV